MTTGPPLFQTSGLPHPCFLPYRTCLTIRPEADNPVLIQKQWGEEAVIVNICMALGSKGLMLIHFPPPSNIKREGLLCPLFYSWQNCHVKRLRRLLKVTWPGAYECGPPGSSVQLLATILYYHFSIQQSLFHHIGNILMRILMDRSVQQ